MLSTLSQFFIADISAAGAGAAMRERWNQATIGVFAIVVWGIVLLGSVFVLWMLIDCLTSSLPTNEKILWVLVIAFLPLLGALLYFFVKRSGARAQGAA